MTSRRHLVLGSALLPWIAALPARAQAAPTRLLLGFPPGGTVDQISRHLSARLGEGVRVEARVGGGGRHAVEELMKAPADGSTLLLTPMSMVTLYPHLYPQLGYGAADPVPVAALASLGFALGVGPAVPASVRTLADLVGWVRAGGSSLPGYGTPGPGTPPHFIGALFERGAQCTLPHVAYRGAAPAMRDLLGGQLAVYIGPEGDFLPHLAAGGGGTVRVLAVAGERRSRFLPDVPTFAEQGHGATGLDRRELYALFLPRQARPELAQQIAARARAVLAEPATAALLARLGLQEAAGGPAELGEVVRADHAAWGPIVSRVGFTPES